MHDLTNPTEKKIRDVGSVMEMRLDKADWRYVFCSGNKEFAT